MRTPLAWKNLTSSFGKCCLASTGVGFAVVLMFMQIGFNNALIDSNIQIFRLFDPNYANLAIVSRARYNISTEQRFARDYVRYATAFSSVNSVCTVSMERGTASIKVLGGPARPIRVIAIDLEDKKFLANPKLAENLAMADRFQGALVDVKSKSLYGFATTVEGLQSQQAELNGKSLPLVGQFRLSTDFGNDGTLLMSERTHSGYFPWRSATGIPTDVVDIAFLHANVASNAELKQLAEDIARVTANQIDVRPTTEFVAREQRFWSRATPIGKIFLIGTLMGLVVGAIICYQIQFTDITEHMPEFATLKAMGYGPSYFWQFIVSQSVYLALLGFIPGAVVAYGLYQILAAASGLVMEMNFGLIASVLGLTILMCLFSGALAIRKLFNTDPANLF